jgi:mannose-6-phosphate isomerase-like protein (cupin superfamily)
MAGQDLHLTEHETLRIIGRTPEELEVEATWDPGAKPPPAHLHPSQDEEFVVQSGRMTAWIDGEERRLEPGDRLLIPRGTPHKMWNPGTATATALWRTRPAGRTAEWFATIDRLTAGGTRKPPLPAMAKAVTQYSDVFVLAVGPKPARPAVQLALRAVGLADR